MMATAPTPAEPTDEDLARIAGPNPGAVSRDLLVAAWRTAQEAPLLSDGTRRRLQRSLSISLPSRTSLREAS